MEIPQDIAFSNIIDFLYSIYMSILFEIVILVKYLHRDCIAKLQEAEGKDEKLVKSAWMWVQN